MSRRSYHELIRIADFNERYEYLALHGKIGEKTFGKERYLNQALYNTPMWRAIKRQVIIRDGACNLAHPDYEIRYEPIYVHHIEPITIDDILNGDPKVTDLDNLIATTFMTHQAIHYGTSDLLPEVPIVRMPNDTCPWKG